jgi:hypothetical protein
MVYVFNVLMTVIVLAGSALKPIVIITKRHGALALVTGTLHHMFRV